MILALRKPLAFVTRDFIDDTSYKLAFILRFSNVFFQVFIFFFLAQLIDGANSKHLATYGGSYFAFALIGLAFTRFFYTTLNGLRTYIRDAQLNGTLEALLATQTGALTIFGSSMLYPFLFTCMQIVVYFVLGELVFDVNITWTNLPVALIVLLLSLISFGSLGFLSAGFIIIYKRGDPVAKLATLMAPLLGGELFPVSVLPDWLQPISILLPITHALEGLRLALLQNYSLAQLSSNLLALVVFAVILTPVSIIFFQWAIKRAKVEGSLSQY